MTMPELAEMMANKYGIRPPEKPAPEPPPEPKITKTKPNKVENQFMIDLMILKNALAVRSPGVRDRLRSVNKHAWRDLRLLYSLVTRLQSQLLDTMPDSRMAYYATLAQKGRYHLDIEGPIRQGRMVLITDTNLAYLCETVLENECLMCLKDGKEIQTCPIRRALLEVSPPTEVRDGGFRCEYIGAAGQLVKGEDVTI